VLHHSTLDPGIRPALSSFRRGLHHLRFWSFRPGQHSYRHITLVDHDVALRMLVPMALLAVSKSTFPRSCLSSTLRMVSPHLLCLSVTMSSCSREQVSARSPRPSLRRTLRLNSAGAFIFCCRWVLRSPRSRWSSPSTVSRRSVVRGFLIVRSGYCPHLVVCAMRAELLIESGHEPGESGSGDSKYSQLFRIKVLHLLALFSLIYVGTEVTLGGALSILNDYCRQA
jgi:hypothetical protein